MDKQSPKAAAGEEQACAMSVQMANSIIAEHMKKAGFEYSLSVFLPEAGLNMDKVCYIHVLYDSGMYPDRGLAEYKHVIQHSLYCFKVGILIFFSYSPLKMSFTS